MFKSSLKMENYTKAFVMTVKGNKLPIHTLIYINLKIVMLEERHEIKRLHTGEYFEKFLENGIKMQVYWVQKRLKSKHNFSHYRHLHELVEDPFYYLIPFA